MNGDQNATSGAHQYTFSHPENMEVHDCKTADTSHEMEHPSMCTSLLAHMAPAYSTTHSASHCLVSHIAPCPQEPESSAVAHRIEAPLDTSVTLSLLPTEATPPLPGAATVSHTVQQTAGGGGALVSHTVTSFQEEDILEVGQEEVDMDIEEAKQMEEAIQEEIIAEDESPAAKSSVEPSTLESSDLVAHIVQTFGLEGEGEEGMEHKEAPLSAESKQEEEGEEEEEEEMEEEMEEQLLAAQRRAEEAEAEAEEAMHMEQEKQSQGYNSREEEEALPPMTVADILESEERKNMEMMEQQESILLEQPQVATSAEEGRGDEEEVSQEQRDLELRLEDPDEEKSTKENVKPTQSDLQSGSKVEADNADVIRALNEIQPESKSTEPTSSHTVAPVSSGNELVSVDGTGVVGGDEERVMADTLATLATLASLVNGDEKMDINSAMLKMQPEGFSQEESGTKDIQHVELVMNNHADGGEKLHGVEVKGGGILEQVRDVEVVVSQHGEVESSMANQLLAEPGTKKKAAEDDVEKQLEAMHKESEEEMQEQILVEDEHMIVGQITSMEELDQQLNQHHMKPEQGEDGEPVMTLHNVTKLPPNAGSARIVQPAEMLEFKAQPSLDAFTEVEDLIIHALDTISPFDAKFISEHMHKREEAQIEKRLNEMDFRKLSFAFGKLPILIFEVVFVNEGILRSRSLMLLTEKQLVSLKCKHEACNHGPGIEQLKLVYNPKSRFGIDTSELCEFIVTNIPGKHMPSLRLNKDKLEQFLDDSKINFHKSAISTFTRKDMKMMNKSSLTMESIKKSDAEPIRIDETGKLTMNAEHEDTLRRIVNAVGKNRWEDATKLLLAVYDHEIDFDVEDAEIYARIAGYYQLRLDPDQDMGVFSDDEDKCIIYMHKLWQKAMGGESLWKHIARHLPGRTANQVKNRFNRKAQGDQDLCLENIKKFAFEPTIPATFENDMAHAFNLTVIPKVVGKDTTDVTTKLQCEARFLVVGTYKQIFLLPCKETALRCTHQNVVTNSFTYDATRFVDQTINSIKISCSVSLIIIMLSCSRPDQQFVTYIKLTFTNGLKKAGLIEDPDEFHFSTTQYMGEGIHAIMDRHARDR